MDGVSPYILIPASAWLAAQLIKYALIGLKSKTFDYKLLYKSGDMPSSHSALVISLLTTVGVLQGIDSVYFGITWVFTAVVIYDAVNVRRAVGEQGRVLNELLAKTAKGQSFYSAKGHTLLEVIVGSVLGLTVAVALLQLL